MRPGRRLPFALVLTALAAFSAPALEGYLPHTDDGCAVEVHCIVCRAQLGTTGVAVPILALPVPSDTARVVVLPRPKPRPDATVRTAASRGPPSSSIAA
jgi:hypothetical protein